ncbi:MAG: hypothetical protein [Wendovervirus sonii]|uniref:Longin domain-containing protein n=1 Tax=phage Lak_Megaphage_Sonny TaxID=3109229 RepID=A0ABZ0Z692_9CAUD|nr:MAG: hypothetical protein [phage Lak_Megaphage_Sonny]
MATVIEKYLKTFNDKCIFSIHMADMAGKTVKFADMRDCEKRLYMVFTDGTFFICAVEYDYYDSVNMVSSMMEFSDIFNQATKKLTPFGKAVGADEDTCIRLLDEHRQNIEQFAKEKRRLEYEKLKSEFEK